ncbi:MarR family winged helix-turn-helix transcriptional regulator [Phycicoccus sonneratiae]|uniref:MarR family transcriptional regulator n=1 Tax=Phycicoccus sonneratiae TaxID=2807628 RepID=A0ABS2CKB3_9MICO|nr:MarR family transcriptional regulator [Phycicoccus sonneraticus]MBM6400324.1 MarR family transcriptional regulator [Phycicoccus sonneraticus]
MRTENPMPPGRRSPTWLRRRGIPADEAADHSPWLRLHEHLAVRHGIRADLPRRWERPEAHDPLNLPALLRQASAQVDRDVARTVAPLAPGLTPEGVDALRRLRDKPSAGVHLAEYLNRSEPQVSRLLSRLTGLGLVQREPGWRDLRTRRTELTETGRRVLATVEAALADRAGEWREGLDVAEVDALGRLLHTFADAPLRRPRRAPRYAPPRRWSPQLEHPVVEAAEAGDGQVVRIALDDPPRSA